MHGRTYVENNIGLDLYRKKYNKQSLSIYLDAWTYMLKSYKILRKGIK